MSKTAPAFKEPMLLSTKDNPWNPHTHFDQWYAWDIAHGYNTLGYLERLCPHAVGLADVDQEMLIQDAYNRIMLDNVNGLYVLV